LLGLVVGRQEIVFIYSVSCSQEVYNTKSCLKGIGWWEVGETIHSLAVYHSIINSFGISLKIAKSQKPKNYRLLFIQLGWTKKTIPQLSNHS
jgi:hypothetical protein